MYKKTFIASLMLVVGVAGFSQTSENKHANPKELAGTDVQGKQKEDLDKMKCELKGGKCKPKFKFNNNKMEESHQFLYQEELIGSVLKAKSKTLEAVFERLKKAPNVPTELVYEGISVNADKIAYKKIESGKKRGETDSTTLIVPVSFETHVMSKDKASDAKYAVTFNWEVEVKPVTEKMAVDGSKKRVKKVVGYELKGKPCFSSSVVKPVTFLTTDREAMRTAAKEAIQQWYANLPQTLDKQYAGQPGSVVGAMNVSLGKIKMNLPNSRTFTVDEVPEILVKVDPYKYISEEERCMYTNPEAYVTLTPKFSVSVDGTLKKATVSSVSYTEKVTEPVPDSVRLQRRRSAEAFLSDFAEQLSVYVSSRDAAQKAYIENMFGSAENKVQVSHLPQHGIEKTKSESAKKYLSLLKGSSLDMANINLDRMDYNLDTLVYIVDQEYRSDTYSDCTKKRIYLTYDAVKGVYVIEKIEVVPNSTVIR